MAVVELIITKERLTELLYTGCDGCDIAITGEDRVMRDMGDVLMIISGSYQSIYVKSPAFSTGDFVIKRMSNPNNPLYYVVDGSSGGGCVNILTNPIKYDFCLFLW